MEKKRVVLVRHGDDPPDDRVYTFLVSNGFEPVLKKPFAGEALDPPDGSVVGAVVYGGKYPAYETAEYPFLNDEYRFIDAVMKRGLPLLGICLGAQQIAYHLGAKVGPVEGDVSEFGYYRIEPTGNAGDFLTKPLHVSQLHYHTFGIPNGAERLAASELFPNQAFRYGDKTYGVQFHPEVTIEGFRRWQNSRWVRYGKPGAQTREEQDQLMYAHDAAQADWFYGFLGRLFGTNGQG
jgi:GMP synthase (glutamine-hydrolysing)